MKFTMVDDMDKAIAQKKLDEALFDNSETCYLLRGIYVETALLRA